MILFFLRHFFEPYASKGACTVSKGYIWIPTNRLYRERMLFLTQMLSNEIGNQLIGLMIYLSVEDKTRELYLYINSPGGWVIPGIGLYDTMQFVDPDVNTIGLGIAASMGCFILMGGTITKRVALPNVRIMVHQPLSVFTDSGTGEFILDLGELVRLRDKIIGAYIQRTGKSFFVINRDLERDEFLSATQAKEYGIVDEVGTELYDP